MKTFPLLLSLLIVLGSNVHAEDSAPNAQPAAGSGFVCVSVDEDVKIRVIHAPVPGAEGNAPHAAAMVVSNPSVSRGHKTIAKFFAERGTLKNEGPAYFGYVDKNDKDAGRLGERIVGVTLKQIRMIGLTVDTSYEHPTPDGAVLAGQAIYIKHNGQELSQDFECHREALGTQVTDPDEKLK